MKRCWLGALLLLAAAPASAAEEEPALTSTVRASRLSTATGGTTLSIDAARDRAGAGGDALNVVPSLPGVARAPAGSEAIVIWGALPGESRLLLDDVPIPWLLHQGGFRGAIPDAALGSIELTPGALPAPYGEALGGLVRLRTVSRSSARVRLRAGVDPLSAQAGALLPGRDDGVRHELLAVGRVGLADVTLPLVAPSLEERVALPAFHDYVLRHTARHAGGTLRLFAFGAADASNRALPAGPADPARTDRVERSFLRLGLEHLAPAGSDAELHALAWAGRDLDARESRFGGAPFGLVTDALRWGLRLARRPVGGGAGLTVGLDAEGTHASVRREGSLGLPARERDPVIYGEPPGGPTTFHAHTAALLHASAFGELRASGAPGELRLGLRAGPARTIVSALAPPTADAPAVGGGISELRFEPRASAELHLPSSFTLFGAVGRTHQLPAPEELSAVYGDPLLGSARADHALAGLRLSLSEAAQLEALGLLRRADDLPVRAAATPPPVAGALASTGEARTRGVQLAARHAGRHGLAGELVVTLASSERRDGTRDAFRRSAWDQRWVSQGTLSYALAETTDLGARARFSTGAPTTDVTGATWDAREGRFRPLPGEALAAELPAFFQLDLRAEHRFLLQDFTLATWAELLNATARENVEAYAFSADFSTRHPLGGLPLTALVGLQVER